MRVLPRCSVRTALIVNANAGATRRQPGLPDDLRALAGGRAELFVTNSSEELAQVARAIATRGTRQVGVVGGDGTASTTLTALWRAYGAGDLPSVALLRGGTMNTVATSIGVSRRSTLDLLRRALRCWDESDGARYSRRPAMIIGERLGFLFGTGVMYGWLSEYYEEGNGHPTPATAARVFGKSVLSALVNGPTYERIMCKHDLEVRFEGGSWERRDYITVGAGTVAQAGLGFQPFHRAPETERAFHLLAIKGGPARIAADLPSIWLGHGMSPRTAYETTTSWAELRTRQPAFGYSVDGDLLTAGSSLRLELGPVFHVLCI
jgi:diacylglycerol kinase (ATP)